MIRRILFISLLLIALPVFGSHIVGGEFELLHINGYQYRLNLIVYFDNLQGNVGARDDYADVRIFRKRDNMPIQDIRIPNQTTQRVSYFQPECSRGEIQTDKLVYSVDIELSPEVYNDPEGYYISYERCCRNYSINNIYSAEPGFGISAGQTFYLEFPPVVKNGEQFINSSPQLFPPLNDYACPNRPYWVDFAGTDVDGDSLSYTLVTPTDTHTTQAIPVGGPQPAPYPQVRYVPPFGPDNIMNGSPKMAISNKGFLTVTPQSSGLFVFSVKCEEFRDGVKLGELTRDFQMLVLNNCPVADAPLIRGKELIDTDYTYVDNMNVTFPNTTLDESRCIQIEVSDPDASKIEDNYTENIYLQVIPIGFDTEANLKDILPTISNTTLSNGSVESFDICFERCPLMPGPYTLGIIAFDDACALPLSDTLRVTVNIEPPANNLPYFVTTDASATLLEGDDYQLEIIGKDDDSDQLIVDILTNGFDLADVGMSFDNFKNENGEFTSTFNWATECDVYDFTERTEFLIKVLLDDEDICNLEEPDTLTLDLKVILPPNTDPIISSDIPQVNFIHPLNEPIEFNVFGLDTDSDVLELRAVGDDFNLNDFDISFPEATGVGQLESKFTWMPNCSNVELDKDEAGEFTNKKLRFYFVLNDLDLCKFPNFDSLEVNVTLIKPTNTAPAISIKNLTPEVSYENRKAELIVGQQLDLELIASDRDVDGITLSLLVDESNVPEGLVFNDVSGIGVVESILSWKAECNNLADNFKPQTYNLVFESLDDVCYSGDTTIVNLELTVKDIATRESEFLPPNVFTPNADGVNDTYSLPDLPVDNCEGQFLSFRVHNRWGTEVYVSIERDFEWDAQGLEAGVYYYIVEYTNTEYNGSLSILY